MNIRAPTRSTFPATRTAPTRARRRWFRLIALCIPFVLLLLLELALRAFGFGYSTRFFLPSTLAGRPVFIENQAFGRNYFPPGLERAPQTIILPRSKPPGTVRLFVFGESAALGDPEPAYGFARILEVMLRETMRGQRVEVINVAMTAINSHVVLDIARDCVDLQGDYWIVYLGNNEVVGPFGAGTVFGPPAPSRALVRAHLALMSTRVGQALDALRWRLFPANSRPATWEGMAMFLQHRVPADDPRLARVHQSFEQNLRAILDLGRRAGARVLVSTVAVNLRDNAPFASAEQPGLDPAQKTVWQQTLAAALAARRATNHADAVAELTRAAASNDGHAELQYALGQAQLGLGRTNEARAALERALELDALRFRADARINGIIRDAEAGQASVQLVDVARWIADRSPFGLPGAEFLFEHVHFNFEGNYEVATCFARAILGDTASTALPSARRCAELLAFTDFDRYRVLDEVRQRLEQPPFTGQMEHEARTARLRAQLSALHSGSFAAAKGIYERAIAARPDDWVLRENFGTLLKDFHLLDEALVHWQRVTELAPHSVDGCLGLADTLEELGRFAGAIDCFRRALQLRPGVPETQHALGLALTRAGRYSEAATELKRALRLDPNSAEAHFDLGVALARLGRLPEAAARFQETLRLQPDHPKARTFLDQVRARLK